MATKQRASINKLVKPTASLVKACTKRASSGSPPPQPPPARDSAPQEVDADLTRALKQIFEVRNAKISNRQEDAVTLFGKKLNQEAAESNSKNEGVQFTPLPRLGSDKLPPAATAHLLKELHKQRLKQRGITVTAKDIPDMGEIEFVHTERKAEMSTMPLLNSLQEKRPACRTEDAVAPGLKRQRTEDAESLDLSFSMWSYGASDKTETAASEVLVSDERSEAAKKNVEQLTLFYNGSVYVYDEVPSDKAKAIMVLASSISSKTSCYRNPPVSEISTSQPRAEYRVLDKEKAGVQNAAKHSIQRFFEKRRESKPELQTAIKASIPRCLQRRKERFNPDPEKVESGVDANKGSSSPDKAAPLLSKNEMEAEASSTTSSLTRQWIGV